jgi:endogenous inhibitor of DNA gyrase (YacG/DUF329 family)
MEAAEAPYFAFESDVKPLPLVPTHCGCGAELEPLRRYAGKCRECIRRGTLPAPAPTARLKPRMVVVRQFFRERIGHRERYVEVRCECGRARVLKWSTWVHARPQCCNRCRLRDIDARGFEAEYAR